MIAKTPKTPYYAVIFTAVSSKDQDDYASMAKKMLALADKQKGFLGVESAKADLGITVSYWDSLAAIQTWKANSFHQKAQEKGKGIWYEKYKIRIAKVARDYEFDKEL